uniref:N, N'-diacetylbacillosaminyl-diphospho-undecaprenol alpha-1,3-N-acetylgalactosaminyltransferase n=1 Tax=Vibrio parahaemolyticus TaxID=670 RepID=A0A7M1W9D2_VIBPH|nr:N,N'-diacetylbacillosaminyl-diphospho-undecaprenol alpha-1,3-N-acetylgalactosaminyltransferase [Vibrio parahaemolyticus]
MNEVVIVQNSIKTVVLFRMTYIKMLIEKGCKVVVIAPNDDNSSFLELIEIGVHVDNIPPLRGLISKALSIARMNLAVLRARRKNSIIICHFISTLIFIYLSLVPFNKRFVVFVEGLGSAYEINRLFRGLIKVAFYFVSGSVFVCNKDEKESLNISKAIVTGGIGVDVEYFSPSNNSIVKSEVPLELLYVGRLIRDKGIDSVIDAFRILLKNNINTRLTVVGDIYINNPSSLTKDDLNQIKSEFGNSINILGYSSNIKECYENAHVLLLPSRREGFPVSVMEASAMGVPTVGYNVPGMSDAIDEKFNGLLAPYRDIDELVAKILVFVDYKKLRHYQIKSREYAIDNFSRTEKDSFIVNYLLDKLSTV